VKWLRVALHVNLQLFGSDSGDLATKRAARRPRPRASIAASWLTRTRGRRLTRLLRRTLRGDVPLRRSGRSPWHRRFRSSRSSRGSDAHLALRRWL